MSNCWLKSDILPPKTMADLRNFLRNNGPVNANAGTHNATYQDSDDVDTMELSSDIEATTTSSDICSSEDGGTKTYMLSKF